jgi:hypothetical protein
MNGLAGTGSTAKSNADIAATLAEWYADHSPIRHLWATEHQHSLTVLVALEPTSDGDDPLPIWLASNRDWAHELRLRVQREVQLQIVAADTFGAPCVNQEAVTIAEVSWRDSWMTP